MKHRGGRKGTILILTFQLMIMASLVSTLLAGIYLASRHRIDQMQNRTQAEILSDIGAEYGTSLLGSHTLSPGNPVEITIQDDRYVVELTFRRNGHATLLQSRGKVKRSRGIIVGAIRRRSH